MATVIDETIITEQPAAERLTSTRRVTSQLGWPEETTPRPVFLIGSRRSGTSLLHLALSQHPTFAPVLTSNWFDQLGIALRQAYAQGIRQRATSQLDISGIELDDFFAHYGEATNRLMLGRLSGRAAKQTASEADNPATREALIPATPYAPTRWVDATPTSAFDVFILLKLFPDAKFIHVIRELRDEIASLTNEDNRRVYKSRHEVLSVDESYEQWLDTVTACVDAERAFGSETVMRIQRRDLLDYPEATLRRCLDFLGEPFDGRALWPFSSVTPLKLVTKSPPSTNLKPNAAAIRAAAELLSDMLFEEPTPRYGRDEIRIRTLEKHFNERWRRTRNLPMKTPAQIQVAEASGGEVSPVRGVVGQLKETFLREFRARSG